MPPTERSSAELTFARHLARAVEDLLTAAPTGLAVTGARGYCCADPARGSRTRAFPTVRPSEETIGSGLGPASATAEGRSALDCVVQVQHAVALNHLVGIVEEDGAGVAAEEAHPVTQNHRGDVHRDLVD
jgi:hypothetical protein